MLIAKAPADIRLRIRAEGAGTALSSPRYMVTPKIRTFSETSRSFSPTQWIIEVKCGRSDIGNTPHEVRQHARWCFTGPFQGRGDDGTCQRWRPDGSVCCSRRESQTIRTGSGLTYPELAFEVIRVFSDDINEDVLKRMTRRVTRGLVTLM